MIEELETTTLDSHEYSTNKVLRIKPFVNGSSKVLGLDKYNEVLFPGTKQRYAISAIEVDGKMRYITGLDEESLTIRRLPSDLRAKEIERIRREVASLYKMETLLDVDINDPRFWDICSKYLPTNVEYWSSIYIELDNNGLLLNLDNPRDRILYNVIKGGGFYEIAPSIRACSLDPNRYRFYLETNDDIVSKVESKKIIAEGIKILTQLFESNDEASLRKMRYISKILTDNTYNIKTVGNERDYCFDILYDYISKNNVRNSEQFIRLSNSDIRFLAVYALLKGCDMSGFLSVNSDTKKLYFRDINVVLEDNIEDSVKKLLHPANIDSLKMIVDSYISLISFVDARDIFVSNAYSSAGGHGDAKQSTNSIDDIEDDLFKSDVKGKAKGKK